MTDVVFEIHLPASLLQFGLDQDQVRRRVVEWLVLSLFTDGHISSGKAARLLGITRVEFLALLRARGIAYINYTPHELADEFTAAKTLTVNEATCRFVVPPSGGLA